MSSNVGRIRVRRCGNGMRRYDGRVEDVELDAIIKEDLVDLAIERTGRMLRGWGKDQRLWTARSFWELLYTPLELACGRQSRYREAILPVCYPSNVHDVIFTTVTLSEN